MTDTPGFKPQPLARPTATLQAQYEKLIALDCALEAVGMTKLADDLRNIAAEIKSASLEIARGYAARRLLDARESQLGVTLTEDDLGTILAIAKNEQSGRITPYEVRELVRVYTNHLERLRSVNTP